MQTRKTHISKVAKQFAGALLAILFLAIPLVQTFHLHDTEDVFSKTDAEQSVASTPEKCLICDYTAEIKGKQILMDYPPVIDIPTSVCIIINTFVYTRIYKFTLQNFSNKGPPSLLS